MVTRETQTNCEHDKHKNVNTRNTKIIANAKPKKKAKYSVNNENLDNSYNII